ncbi:hypothetical protein EVAR_26960_1 [Eumeta japonica]|uniref:SWIM-type domain-containing protein n=1 Tax=Eumeta variegata TaxID=151549 RepID=A0A4C1VMQ1_EUMVA|nr:hypothetical protein EVAR_26960_1 [Eumeta japonica]
MPAGVTPRRQKAKRQEIILSARTVADSHLRIKERSIVFIEIESKYWDMVSSARESTAHDDAALAQCASAPLIIESGRDGPDGKEVVPCSTSSRPSYGDDAVSYVQLKREGDICVVKCKVCPKHKVHAKLHSVTLIMDEQEEAVKSIECHDCVALQGGCKHAIAFLMWIHRRSEEPSCTSVECYWMKSKLSRAGSTLKYLTASEMSNAKPSCHQIQKYLKSF